MATQDHPTPRQFVEWRKHLTPLHFAFIDLVAPLNYRKRRAILHQQSIPRYLYKFRSCAPLVGKDTWIDRLRDVLVRSHLWLSSPSSFNDPFDTSAQVVLGGNAREVRKTFDDFLKERGVKRKQREKHLKHFMSAGIETFGPHAQRTFEHMRTTSGVYSFGGNSLSVLMWSHYGEDHRGLCLQFDVAQDVENFTVALPVNYSKEFPILDWVGINNGSQNVTTVLLQKSEEWRYENEHRIIVPEGAGKYLAFDPAALTGIIIGCLTPETTLERLKELLSERSEAGLPSPRIHRVLKHDCKYRLLLKRVEL